MTDTRKVITVDDFQHRVLIGALNKVRTDYLTEGKPTEDVDELLIITLEAPNIKEKRKTEREGR